MRPLDTVASCQRTPSRHHARPRCSSPASDAVQNTISLRSPSHTYAPSYEAITLPSAPRTSFVASTITPGSSQRYDSTVLKPSALAVHAAPVSASNGSIDTGPPWAADDEASPRVSPAA